MTDEEKEKFYVNLTLTYTGREYYEEDYPQYMDLFKPSVIVQYNDEKEYQFGGEAVAENMAYLFEKLFFNANDYEKSF